MRVAKQCEAKFSEATFHPNDARSSLEHFSIVKYSVVQTSIAKLFFIIKNMTLKETKQKAKENRPVDGRKFDRHMARARRTDIESRQEIFVVQTEQSETRREKIVGIKPSLY